MSKLGRRRPFIITGGILVCVSLLSLGYVEPIAQSLESNHDETMVCGKMRTSCLSCLTRTIVS